MPSPPSRQRRDAMRRYLREAMRAEGAARFEVMGAKNISDLTIAEIRRHLIELGYDPDTGGKVGPAPGPGPGLEATAPPGPEAPRRRGPQNTNGISSVPGQPDKLRLRIDAVLGWQVALDICKRIQEELEQ